MIIRCLYCVLLLASLSYWNSEFEYFLERSRSPYFLSLEVHTSDKGKFLTNRSTHDLVDLACLTDAKTVGTPLKRSVKYRRCDDGDSNTNLSLHRTFVGSLIYLTTTQLNISHAICIISQFMHDLCHLHLSVVEQNLIQMQSTILWIVLSSQCSQCIC